MKGGYHKEKMKGVYIGAGIDIKNLKLIGVSEWVLVDLLPYTPKCIKEKFKYTNYGRILKGSIKKSEKIVDGSELAFDEYFSENFSSILINEMRKNGLILEGVNEERGYAEFKNGRGQCVKYVYSCNFPNDKERYEDLIKDYNVLYQKSLYVNPLILNYRSEKGRTIYMGSSQCGNYIAKKDPLIKKLLNKPKEYFKKYILVVGDVITEHDDYISFVDRWHKENNIEKGYEINYLLDPSRDYLS